MRGVPDDPLDVLREGLAMLEVPDPAGVFSRMRAFIAELERWNPRFRLVSCRDRTELVIKHVLDSLAGGRALGGAATALDVGSGAGFPGIPLAAALAGCSFTLLERMSRRVSFLRNCAILLDLPRVRVLPCGLSEAAGDFDVVTFRAVAPLARFLEEIRRSGVRWGRIVAYKGRIERARAEAEEARSAAGAGIDIDLTPLRVPFLDEERCLIVVRRKSLLTNA